MKKSLEDLPRYIAVDAWNDFLSWLKDYQRASGIEKNASVPFIEAHFGKTLAAATRIADNRRQIEELSGDAHKLSLHLASKLKHLDDLQFKRESALPGADLERIDAKIEVARYNARALEVIVEEKEKEAQAADGADEIADNTDFVPLDEPVASSNVRSWPEDNYEDFATKRATVSDSMVPISKLPSASLFVKQKTPAGSKTLMPRPLELFTAAEIDDITPKSIKSRWCNFYEDPIEPAKCWTQEEFQVLYEKPGFHFMIARVAQVRAQFRDSKLSSLKSKLAERWKMDVQLQRMHPRMDWMMATIPAITDASKEILLTSLIRLQEGNTVYVVQHFAAPAKIRELEITIANTITEPGSLFHKLKKRCQEFEKSNVLLALSTWILTRSIGLGSMIGPTLMAPPLNPSPCSTSTWLGKHASLTRARFATTLIIISSSVPFLMSRLGVYLWSVRYHAGWLPIESLLRGVAGRMTRSTKSKEVLTISGMGKMQMVVLSLLILPIMRLLTLSWTQLLTGCLWLQMMVLLLRVRSLITPSPN